MRRTLLLAALLALAPPAPSPLRADEPLDGLDNACAGVGGQGTPCVSSDDCAVNGMATLCVERTEEIAPDVTTTTRRCEIPCMADEDADDPFATEPALCALGETCVTGKPVPALPASQGAYCQPARFRVDLNLLDQCLSMYLNGGQPQFSSNDCSLEANLTRLLDQNQDQRFDLYDADLCILSFLEQPGCTWSDEGTPSDASDDGWVPEEPDLVCCDLDEDCGVGLYCDELRNTCQRDCGVIASREPELMALERECSGALTTCDYTRGRCVSVDPSWSTCDVDTDCTAGAYCFLGRCEPRCYRALDCPTGSWYCDDSNRCRALPHPDADPDAAFDPHDYSVRFARDGLRLDAIQTFDSSDLLIMDIRSRRQVVGDPSVTFGYRLEVRYGLKQDVRCLKPFVDCDDAEALPEGETQADCQARQDDCYIDDSEEWLRLAAPFGTISGAAPGGVRVDLEEEVLEHLTPGSYPATIRAIFDNGGSDSIPVRLVKTSPSGEYAGNLTVYIGSVANSLSGSRPLTLTMRIKVEETLTQWHDLLLANHLGVDEDIIDLTSGYLVHARLHGNQSLAFTRSRMTSTADNEIPFVGLYSPDQGRIRLLGVIEVDPDFCISEEGGCAPGQDQIQVVNPFGRLVRRQIELVGPFDDASGRFHGLYREKISGLAADFDVTLEGGFILDQVVSDDSPMDPSGPLLSAGAEAVTFPSASEVLDDFVDPAVEDVCGSHIAANAGVNHASWARAQFATDTAFMAYLARARRRPAPNTATATLGPPIFHSLVDFGDAIREALSGLGSGSDADEQAQLNIYDFLSSRLLPCDAQDPAPPPACIDEETARCGLSLYQSAFIQGWIDLDAVDGTGENDLFCPETLNLSGCPDEASGAEGLFALQDHNRFWWNLGQILKFSGDRARSDAFLVLFREEDNPFEQQSALSYKADRLREAVARYDELVELIVAPAAAKVLFEWPARAFKQWGNDWLAIMHDVVAARMETLAELIDLERRVFMGTDEHEFAFAQHMMQHEYLIHVFLMALQEHWQKDGFGYLGQAGPAFDKGQAVLDQLNPARNPLGLVANRVYFENSNPARSNWLNYRDILAGEGGDGGLLGAAQATVDDAVDEMQAALSDLDTLEESLLDSKLDLEERIGDLCGRNWDYSWDDKLHAYTPHVGTDSYCDHLTQIAGISKAGGVSTEWKDLRDCLFDPYVHGKPSHCPEGVKYTCPHFENAIDDNNDCSMAVKTFIYHTTNDADPLDDSNAEGSQSEEQEYFQSKIYGDGCVIPMLDELHWITVNGGSRTCIGGQMGELLHERAALKLQRRIVLRKVHELLLRMEDFSSYLKSKGHYKDAIYGLETASRWAGLVLDIVADTYEIAYKASGALADGVKCMLIVGFSFGTDCPQGLLSAAVRSGLTVGTLAFLVAVKEGRHVLSTAIDQTTSSLTADIDALEAGLQQRATEREIGALIDELFTVTQELLAVSAKIDDTRFKAQAAADRFHAEVSFVAEHLVGRETGNLILGDQLVRDASAAFEDLVLFAYKMVLAFVHEYNVPEGEANLLINRALAMVTLDDVGALVSDLEDWERDYCGQEAIDCDTATNVEVLRFSVRDQLFPQLRDVVDAHTGAVLTAGEQFHDLITQAPFMRRRVRGTHLTDQIEVNLDLSIAMKENTADGVPLWVIDPLTCNHHLDARDPTDPTGGGSFGTGTVAANVVGRNLGDGELRVRYELVRGATDSIRSCHPESVQGETGTDPVLEYPVRSHIIGYAPQSIQAQEGEQESFFTRSTAFTACMNQPEGTGDLIDGACWRFFARDRSLASPDWKIMIPVRIGGGATDNTWILGEGLPDDARPLIEDIVLYFRYRARPIQEG